MDEQKTNEENSNAIRAKETVEELKKALEEAEKQKEEYLGGWKRERADFINYKKEETARVEALTKFIHGAFILKILDLIDSFDLADKNLGPEMKENQQIKGLLQIRSQFNDFLKSQGVEPIESLGQQFEPSKHEAIAESENAKQPPGTIIEEISKGYTLNGKLLRPAKVKVSK
jgi:molecular chaperone GrpE